MDLFSILVAAGAGAFGGAMNALAGGGTFATLPALLAAGLPANLANSTSNVALLPGACASAWSFRDELAPVGSVSHRTLAAITFAASLVGSMLLVLTPSDAFDVIVPWLLLIGFVVMAFGTRASEWLRARVTIGRPTLFVAQTILGIYGGYFGGGVGLMLTATYGLLAGAHPRSLFSIRTLMLATANSAAAIIFVAFGMVVWIAAVPMLLGGIVGGWLGAIVGKRLPHAAIRAWTLLVTGGTTIVFFVRAYG